VLDAGAAAADPKDKAEIYRELGVQVAYDPAMRLVSVNPSTPDLAQRVPREMAFEKRSIGALSSLIAGNITWQSVSVRGEGLALSTGTSLTSDHGRRSDRAYRSPRYLPSSTLIEGVIPMITTVNPKGQVTIPEPLRDRYGFPPGTKVVWLERDGDLIPKPLLSVEQLRGRFKGGELTAMLLEERARDRKHEDG
jgi:bifunctional DNA-binding transcriptional regulator/antitoxin component of YhaV-PrlF toxin-antitoxin module